MEELKRVNRELIHKGVTIDFYADTMELPNGHRVIWDHIDHKGAAAVLPVLPDGRIVLVRQYRNSVDQFTWEIPAGGLNDRTEPMIEAARRELMEETGYTTEKPLEFLISLHSVAAYCNERIDVFVADELKSGERHLDEDEFIDVQAFTLEEIQKKIFAGEMHDSKTIAAVMSYACKVMKQS
ncbi:MAG: NUDIX hydrolase [Lachnospiraceae bacterium]|nr:NUDIX hydrolase [Lachnospiraceae bacterium]